MWDINSGYAVGFNGTIIKLISSGGFTVTTSSNPISGGTTSGGGAYSSGSTVTISSTAGISYQFHNWVEGNNIVSTNSAYTFVISSNRNFTANFKPTAPTATDASSISQTYFNANWNAVASATGYSLDVAIDNSFTNFVAGYNDLDVGNILTFSVNTNLIANTTYYYRVRAYNSVSSSNNSNTKSITTLPNPPPSPLANSATQITQTSFYANWNNSNSATGYKIDVAVDDQFTNILSTYNNKDVGNVTTLNITGLTTNVTCFYRVRAYNPGGNSANSNIITLTTLRNPPATPVSSPANAITQTSFNANWNISNDATSYILDVSNDANFNNFVINNLTVGNVTSYQVTVLNPGTQYWYRIKANNNGGNSSYSNVINTITLHDATGATAATVITTSGFNANWNASPGATGYRLDV